MKINLLKSLGTILLFLIISFTSFSQAGTLDSTFGINGKVETSTGADGYGCRKLVLQNDGKILALGNSPINWIDPNSLILCRYNTNGSIDNSFGENGKVLKSFNLGLSLFVATAIVIQDDGKILIGGGLFEQPYSTDHFVLVRFLSNGLIDSSFGLNGVVYTYIGPFPKENTIATLALQSDGKILAGGTSDGFCLIRYNPSGSIDSSFALNGIYINREDEGTIYDIRLLSNNKILISGSTGGFYTNSDFKIIRLTRKGTIDSTFGFNGSVVNDFWGDYDQINSMVLLDDGKILAAGSAFNPAENIYHAVVIKYNSNGSIDTSFSTNGKLITAITGNYQSYGQIMIQQDKKFLITGLVYNLFYVSRFNDDGSNDLLFGQNGKAIATFGIDDKSYTAAIKSNGNIVVGGGADFKLACFKGESPVEISFAKNISVTEGNLGYSGARFKVTLSKVATQDVFVNYTTSDINAIAGLDYSTTSGTLMIKAGRVSGVISVPIIGDILREANEKFSLVLNNPINAFLGAFDSATCMIKNDDAQALSAIALSQKGNSLTTNISIYPNPASEILTINTTKPSVIILLNQDGRKILTKIVNSFTTIDVSSYSSGIYYLLNVNSGEKISFVVAR